MARVALVAQSGLQFHQLQEGPEVRAALLLLAGLVGQRGPAGNLAGIAQQALAAQRGRPALVAQEGLLGQEMRLEVALLGEDLKEELEAVVVAEAESVLGHHNCRGVHQRAEFQAIAMGYRPDCRSK